MTKYSSAQTEIWRVREELDAMVAPMTPEQLSGFLDSALGEFQANTGVELRIVRRPEALSGESLPPESKSRSAP